MSITYSLAHKPTAPAMSDLDTLIVTFQTQLSDVMETVVKTAMFEVTRLVEDVFLVEVKRRDQEVESLRMQLHWTESKFNEDGGKEERGGRGGGNTGKCVDCGRDAVELSADTVDERPENQPDDLVTVCSVKKEADSVERWISNCREEALLEAPQEAERPTTTQRSPEREAQPPEEEDEIPVDDMKEEGLDKPSCTSAGRLGQWSGSADGELDGSGEMEEAQEEEKSLRTLPLPDLQIHAAYSLSSEQQETHRATNPPHVPSLEMDVSWAGLTATATSAQHNHRLGPEKEHDPVKSKASQQERSDSVRAEPHVLPARDHISSSGSPEAGPQHGDAPAVTIKEEVVIDCDGCEESKHREKGRKSATPSFSRSTKHHRVGSETRKPNHIYHKAGVQEVMKLHSRVGSGLRLQAALQNLHRPVKKLLPHTLSNSAVAALSAAQAVNLNNLNRIPSTSKATAPPAPGGPRLQLGDKQTSGLHRAAAAPWVSIKAQHPSANAAAQPDFPHPAAGPRHLLRCGQCGKCFPHPSNLKAHLQTHTGERPFCCSLCGRSFTKLSNLKAHRRVHTGERPYCCLACGKRFTQKCNLKRHQRIHLDG